MASGLNKFIQEAGGEAGGGGSFRRTVGKTWGGPNGRMGRPEAQERSRRGGANPEWSCGGISVFAESRVQGTKGGLGAKRGSCQRESASSRAFAPRPNGEGARADAKGPADGAEEKCPPHTHTQWKLAPGAGGPLCSLPGAEFGPNFHSRCQPRGVASAGEPEAPAAPAAAAAPGRPAQPDGAGAPLPLPKPLPLQALGLRHDPRGGDGSRCPPASLAAAAGPAKAVTSACAAAAAAVTARPLPPPSPRRQLPGRAERPASVNAAVPLLPAGPDAAEQRHELPSGPESRGGGGNRNAEAVRRRGNARRQAWERAWPGSGHLRRRVPSRPACPGNRLRWERSQPPPTAPPPSSSLPAGGRPAQRGRARRLFLCRGQRCKCDSFTCGPKCYSCLLLDHLKSSTLPSPAGWSWLMHSKHAFTASMPFRRTHE